MKKELELERDVERWLNEGGRDVERAPRRTREPKPNELAISRADPTTTAKETRQ
jgi:hypothetical protein